MPIDSGPTPTGTLGEDVPSGPPLGSTAPEGQIGGDTPTGTMGIALEAPVRTPLSKQYKAGDCIVVYSVATGRIRRWYASDTTDEIKDIDLMKGEAVLHVDALRGLTPEMLQERINLVLGKEPANDRYVLIDPDGKIVSALLADPDCGDSAEHFGLGYELVQHDKADLDWTYDRQTQTFTAPPRPDPKPGRS